jgi:hypothetical protein
MKSNKEMTNAELATFVESHLRNQGIDFVLSSGTCVSIYSINRYVSMDLDLINTRFAKRRRIRDAMREIGFSEEGRYFKHPDIEFFIELSFLEALYPLAINRSGDSRERTRYQDA